MSKEVGAGGRFDIFLDSGLPKAHAVAGSFYPRPFFAAKITIVSPLPPLYNVEWIVEALSYLERHNFPLQCYLYHLHTTLFHGGGDFIVRLQHKSQEVFQDLWQAL